MGRPGKLLVTVRDGELTVMVPPGESAVFGVDQLEQLVLLRSAVTLGIGPSGALCLPCVIGVTAEMDDPGRFGTGA